MRNKFLLISGCFFTSVFAGGQLSAQDISAETLIDDYAFYNDICRGGSGGDDSTWEACGARNYILYTLNRLGVCYGKGDQASYQHRWHSCSSGSLRSLQRPDYVDAVVPNSSTESLPTDPDFQLAFNNLPSATRLELQDLLSKLSYYEGRLDAKWGPRMQTALSSALSRDE